MGSDFSLIAMLVLHNKAGQEIAIIAFDSVTGEWRISDYDNRGFSTAQEAWEFWSLNFDPQTGVPNSRTLGREPAVRLEFAYRA